MDDHTITDELIDIAMKVKALRDNNNNTVEILAHGVGFRLI